MRNPCEKCPVSLIYNPPILPFWYRKPLYTNNSLVFYKSNSLPSCGVGSVVNSRAIARRT